MTCLVFGFLVSVAGVGFLWWRHRDDPDRIFVTTFFGTAWIAATAGLTILSLFLTSGLVPGYSTGIRDGYIVKISQKGVIWKTWEGELQLGGGAQGSIQPPFEFTVTDETHIKKVRDCMAKMERVHVHYKQWLVMPWRVGDSGYEVTVIESAEAP